MKTKLQKAVIRQLGGGKDALESLKDVANHGADCGFSGFVYYKDTVDFYRKNKKEIVAHLEQMAGELGENVLTMIKSFKCLNNDFSEPEIAKVIYGNYRYDNESYDIIANALAWYALEETARELTDN